MPLVAYPPNTDLVHQSVEIPGSRTPGHTGVWKSNIWDRSFLTSPEMPKTLFELFEQSVSRHPDRALFLRRPVLPPVPPATAENPVYGTTLVPTSYAAVQTRRTNLGGALLALERAGRLRRPDEHPSSVPHEVTQSGVPAFGNENRAKAGSRRGWGVGLWSKNREEWQVVDLACHAYGLVSVSLYETLGPDVAKYMCVGVERDLP